MYIIPASGGVFKDNTPHDQGNRREGKEKRKRTNKRQRERRSPTCPVRPCNTEGSMLSRGSDEGVKAKSSL